MDRRFWLFSFFFKNPIKSIILCVKPENRLNITIFFYKSESLQGEWFYTDDLVQESYTCKFHDAPIKGKRTNLEAKLSLTEF